MAVTKTNPEKGPWFSFHAVTFLTSQTVKSMTMAERGIYITLLSLCWRDGSLPWDAKELAHEMRINSRTVQNWMAKFGKLAAKIPELSNSEGQSSESIPEVVFPDQQVLSERKGKTGHTKSPHTDIQTLNTDNTDTEKRVAPVVSDTKTKTTLSPVTVETPVKPKGFDPLTYSEPVTSTGKGEQMAYPSEDVHRTLLYHFKHNPSEFWQGKVTSSVTLARYINTMYEQMVRDAGEDWTPPEAKQSKELRRMAGDPACLKCRGTGKVTERDGMTRYSVECPACEKHEQVFNRATKEWEDVEPNA